MKMKKSISTLLICALVIGLWVFPNSPLSLAKEVSANTSTTRSMTNSIRGQETYLGEQIYMYAGDVVTFTFDYSPIGGDISFGLVEPGNIYMGWRRTNDGGPKRTYTYNVTKEGYHRLWIQNHATTGNVVTSGTYTHINRFKTNNVRIITDNSSINSAANMAYQDAVPIFRSKFGIHFSRVSTTVNSNLNGDCPNTTRYDICRAGIGVTECGLFCDTLGHHKGATSKLNVDRASSSEFVIRYVNYRICYSNFSHDEAAGMGDVKGRNTVVSHIGSSTIEKEVVQHELGHNLGVSGHCDGNGQYCIMKSNNRDPYFMFNSWCTSCTTAILNYAK